MKLNTIGKNSMALALALSNMMSVGNASAGEQPGMKPAVLNFDACQKPAWPKEALRKEQKGTVKLSFLVGEDGKVTDSILVSSSGFPLLDDAAQHAILLCQFQPAQINGIPVASWTPMQYVWTIDPSEEDTQVALFQANFYRDAALKGDVTALYNLGVLFQNLDRSQTRNLEFATRMFRQAADRGHADAQYQLANSLAYGQGISRNIEQAALYYEKAAEQGNLNAQSRIATMYETGTGVAPNAALAAKWYRKAAEQGDPAAQESLARHLEAGTGVEHDDAQAASWYRKAAEADVPAAQSRLGLMYLHGKGIGKDLSQAIFWLSKAAKQRTPEAEVALGELYIAGKGVPQSDAEGWTLLRRAAAGGNIEAMAVMGCMQTRGSHVTQDAKQGQGWLAKAAALGSSLAAECRDSSKPINFTLGE